MEVNGVAVTGNSQSEVAGLLRQIPIGGTATLIVSRQDQRGSEGAAIDSTADDKPSSPLLPRQLVMYQSYICIGQCISIIMLKKSNILTRLERLLQSFYFMNISV